MIVWLSGLIGERAAKMAVFVAPWLLLPLAFLLGQCDGKRIEANRQEVNRALATTQALQVDASAKETAEIQRQVDNAAITNQTEVYANAIQSAPSSAPGSASVALACARLRATPGRTAASLPTACRSATTR